MKLDLDHIVNAQITKLTAEGRTPARILIGPVQARTLIGDFVTQEAEPDSDLDYTVDEFVDALTNDAFVWGNGQIDLPVSVTPDVDGVEVLAE